MTPYYRRDIPKKLKGVVELTPEYGVDVEPSQSVNVAGVDDGRSYVEFC